MQKIFLFLTLIFINSNLSFCQTAEKLPYERFVGLGSCCVTRTQINHHLSTRFNKPVTEFGGGQLFDWVIIRDYNKLAEAIENQLSNLLERLDLGPVEFEQVYTQNNKYNMIWAHLFNITDTSVDVKIALDSQYPEKKQKIDYLSQKFMNLSH